MEENCSIFRSDVAALNDSASLIDDMNIMKGIMNGVDCVQSVPFVECIPSVVGEPFCNIVQLE
jgi:hypothetical protein